MRCLWGQFGFEKSDFMENIQFGVFLVAKIEILKIVQLLYVFKCKTSFSNQDLIFCFIILRLCSEFLG